MIKERPAIEEVVVQVVEEDRSWKRDLIRYLKSEIFPDDPVMARMRKFKAARFTMIGDELYKRTTDGPLLKCLDEERAKYVLREFHEGCDFARKCESYQRFASLIHTPATPIEPIRIACPFDQWGIDILGPFPLAVAQKKFIVVAVEYFTKWVEAEALGKAITAWCTELKIQQNFTAVGNPQANGQTEVTNRTILQHLKTKLEGAKSSWVEELPGVLLAYRPTPRSSTDETPFCLVYGSEAIIPAEIGEEMQIVTQYDPKENQEARAFDLAWSRRRGTRLMRRSCTTKDS
ncbi:UNVERIFIED_CONTAM: hypothetical protein Slati_4602200 [Sesamum latifolium]|uniref:Integrase catalytic domain-containing protein n=1 Tax=Sesamum latifolium TaxID=2727402 RepID=A0AAW2S1T8_9LAMI